MKKLFKAFGFTAAGLAVLLGAGFLWVRSSLPPAHDVARLKALDGVVRVYRDAHGIPHIFAETLDDAFAGLGYLHASDRLFQMDMTRRAGAGRLAEVLGPDLVGYDKKMRVLGFGRLAEQNFSALSADAQQTLNRYAEGVNLYLAQHKGAWPAEFTLLGFAPEPWRASDGLLWAKLLGWQLSANLDGEIFRAALMKKGWSREQVDALYPAMDVDAPVTTKPLEWKGEVGRNSAIPLPLREGLGVGSVRIRQAFSPVAPTPPPAPPSRGGEIGAALQNLPHQASNAYVLGGSRTVSGKPLLANDPHLQLQAPVLWYMARIVTPEFELKGATAPGLPLFPLGQNGHVAWGFTTNSADVQDLVFVPEDRPMALREEIIKAKGAADVTFTVRSVEGNPVISDAMPDVAAITPTGRAGVLVTTGLDENDHTAESLMLVNQARSLDDIERALLIYRSPPQNMMAADAAGAIAYYGVGVLPVRSGDGFMPVENGTARIWERTAVPLPNPSLKNPAADVILNANNALLDAASCKAASCTTGRTAAEPYRAMRLEDLLRDAMKQDAETASAPMLDSRSVAAMRLMPRLLPPLKNAPADLVSALRAWDGAMLAARPEPLLFHVFIARLMGEAFGDAQAADVTWPRLRALEEKLAALPPEKITAAFDAAFADLSARFGPDWRSWRWGDVHKAQLPHPVWSRVPLLGDLFSLAVETDGDGTTLRRAAPSGYAGDAAFADAHGAGYRAVYDLADPAQSRFMIATGQSGQPLSPHYGDMVKLWAKGAFIGMTGDEKAFIANGKPALLMMP